MPEYNIETGRGQAKHALQMQETEAQTILRHGAEQIPAMYKMNKDIENLFDGSYPSQFSQILIAVKLSPGTYVTTHETHEEW